jgi:hypothetical protein
MTTRPAERMKPLAERDLFEQWARKLDLPWHYRRYENSDKYEHPALQTAWLAWQASARVHRP